MGIPITSRLKEIKKRRALFGNQRVELLINSVGKRTVVVLNPSFFYFFNPFFVIDNILKQLTAILLLTVFAKPATAQMSNMNDSVKDFIVTQFINSYLPKKHI